jgi:hypothetical protein
MIEIMTAPKFTGTEAQALNMYLELLDTSFKDKIKLTPIIKDRTVILDLYQDARIESMTDYIKLYRE